MFFKKRKEKEEIYLKKYRIEEMPPEERNQKTEPKKDEVFETENIKRKK